MDLGLIKIDLTKGRQSCNSPFWPYFLKHFQPFEGAGVTLTAEELKIEIIKAFGLYLQAESEKHQNDELTLEESIAMIPSITVCLIDAIINNRNKAIILFRQIKDKANSLLEELTTIERRKPLAFLDEDFNAQKIIWEIIAAITNRKDCEAEEDKPAAEVAPPKATT